MNSCLLSTAYWAPVQYFSKLLLFDTINIEQWETYPKQSYRNRMLIYGANGIQSLQVPVIKGSNKNILLKDIKISYTDNWQKNHLKSIESAYRSAPFYEYYIDDILPIYQKHPKYLLDLNQQILVACMAMLDIEKTINMSSDFILNPSAIDLRNTMHPKFSKNIYDKNFQPIEYMQCFEQRHGFVPNLSIVDLIFNVGPEASSLIRQSIADKT